MQKICVVIPCYNEQFRLPIQQFSKALETTDYHFLFVDDGSTDATVEVLKKLQLGNEKNVSILEIQKNGGKAEAVRQGMMAASQIKDIAIIGFMDADLATPLTEIPLLVHAFDKEIKFVFGSRVRRIGTDINRKVHRHIIGRVFATLVSLKLGIGVYDTQCGAKFFKKEIVPEIFSQAFITQWIFDVEIFMRLKQINQGQHINDIAKEIPLEKWEDIANSTLKPKHFISIALEFVQLMFV